MTIESPTHTSDHAVPALDVDTKAERFDVELHDLCKLFPSMSGTEFDELKADIRTHGLLQPIVMHEGAILDGANRYRACKEIGLKPTTIEFGGGDAASYVLSANLHRRHLTPGQQAAIVASAQDWSQAHTRGGDGSNQHGQKEKTGNVAGLQTVADRVALSRASERTQRMADKVAKKSPDLAKKVAHGEVSLPQAHKQIALTDSKAATRTVPGPRWPFPVLPVDVAAPEAPIPGDSAKLVGKLKQEIAKLSDRNATLEQRLRKRDATIKKLKADLEDAKHEIGALMRGFDKAKALTSDQSMREELERRGQLRLDVMNVVSPTHPSDSEPSSLDASS